MVAESSETASTRVLIVDDDPTCLKYAERLLSERGHACQLALDVRSAREALQRSRFDVVVTDLHLPDGDGLSLLRDLVDAQGVVPAIVMTGFPSLGSAVDALRLDVMDYVTKPALDLDERVERVLQKARARTGPASDWAQKLRALADELDRGGNGVAAAGGEQHPMADAEPDTWRLLTNRERAVARLLVAGAAPAQIAKQLGVSLNTVRNHVQSAFKKAGARSQLELVAKLNGRRS